MSGTKVNDYSIGDSNIQSVMLTLDKAFKGFHQVSLTNYNTTSESAIAAGSVVEVNGALYKFDSDESITGSPSNGTVYIYLVPSGDTVTAAYTNTAPTWSDSKQGWYGTGGNANYRYIGGVSKNSTVLTHKFILIDKNGIGLKYFRDSVSFGVLEDLNVKKLTIEDLQMYAFGRKQIFSWTSTAGGASSNFNILKPMTVTTTPYNNYANSSSFNINPGVYRLYKADSGTPTKLQRYLTTCYENVATITDYTSNQTFTLYCIYAEGCTSLDDTTILIS